jgi:hypothetical protein
MSKLMFSLVLTAILAWVPWATAHESVEAIQKILIEKWDSHTSLSGVFSVAGQVKISPDIPTALAISGNGTLDYLKKDGKALHRVEGWAGPTKELQLARIFSTFDGAKGHADTMFFGQNGSEDYGPADVIEPSGKAIFDEMAANMTLKAMPSTKVGDKDCHVLEGVLKEPVDDVVSLTKLVMCFDKATGVPVRIGLIDKQNVEFGAITMTDAKIDQEISVEKFKYTPPPAPPAAPAPATPATAAPAAAQPATK